MGGQHRGPAAIPGDCMDAKCEDGSHTANQRGKRKQKKNRERLWGPGLHDGVGQGGRPQDLRRKTRGLPCREGHRKQSPEVTDQE